MVEYIVKCSVVLLLVISAAVCENCVTYEFDTNFYDSFNHGKAICDGIPSWNLEKYSESDVSSPHPNSDFFISPGTNLSCVSSYAFEMKPAGILEVNVYMKSASKMDQLVILAQEMTNSKQDPVAGTVHITPLNIKYIDGWHVVKVDLFGSRNFNGYITFLGIAAPESTIIVDSFRYIPPSYENECYLYEAGFIPPTPKPPPSPTECITYDFEQKFDESFNSHRGLCTGFTEWTVKDYDSTSIERPTSDSNYYISPQVNISCVSSFPFNVEAGGTIEVNVYMESKSENDQIAVLASQIMDDNNDAITGSSVLTPLRDNYVDGWQVIRIRLSGIGIYNGYLSFLGVAMDDSTVLIDSFRYVPPNVAAEECPIYEEELFQTTTPLPSTTPVPNGDECVTYNFESDFLSSFNTDTQLCTGFSGWHLGTYTSLNIESLYPESTTFISPNISSSCISSFIFAMKPEGVVEVNVYMELVSDNDFVIVLAKKVAPNGVDTVSGFQLYYATNKEFVEGWNTLSVTVHDFHDFNGYITLIGSAKESIVLIDSFRYTPPNYEEPCKIY